MARTRKTANQENTQENTQEQMPEPQLIIAPIIDSTSVILQEESSFAEPEPVAFNISEESNVTNEVQPLNKKTIIVYEDGVFLEELDENSEKIDEYLSLNKRQLEDNIALLNNPVTDPNTLIYFHEGVQPRKYLSFESYYAQNGLAPKLKVFNTWMDFYKNKFYLSAEEEIAIKVKGNLKYSFTLKIDNENTIDS